ncbi:hypothetical protein ACJDU8_06930 [Clostridium sp. WILCCON 0269]|uniref:Uncharacterized protein n=1 Tax=Candidatus Clostridium eludens TaxID=3381663 RepID=A0ABW8SKF3_9CLOT
MVKKEPMIGGSGISQVEGVVLKKLKTISLWYRVTLGKLIGGITTIGQGSKLLERTKIEKIFNRKWN